MDVANVEGEHTTIHMWDVTNTLFGETEGEKEEGVGKLITEVAQVGMVSLIAKFSVGIVIAQLCRYSSEPFSFFLSILLGQQT